MLGQMSLKNSSLTYGEVLKDFPSPSSEAVRFLTFRWMRCKTVGASRDIHHEKRSPTSK